jgi:hypothetical protein
MPKSKFASIPDEIKQHIIRYFTIQDLMHLYQASHYWKRRLGSDKILWRRVYERDFGDDFANDDWILWAVRRLRSQSLSEEERLSARQIDLTTLEDLDAYTWYRLVRGRLLTEKNWKEGTVQHAMCFADEKLAMQKCFKFTKSSKPTYGHMFAAGNYGKSEPVVIDDTPNDASSDNPSSSGMIPRRKILNRSNVTPQRIIPASWGANMAGLDICVSSEEFIVAEKDIFDDSQSPPSTIKGIFVWHLGRLETRNISGQPCCVPRLHMTELLPYENCYITMQKGGWLIVKDDDIYLDQYTQHKSHQYIIYDLRRGRIAASFIARVDAQPIIGRATPYEVQIYYGYTTLTTHTTSGIATFKAPKSYYWHVIEIKARSNIPLHTSNPSWYGQMPSPDVLSSVRERHSIIDECVNEKVYWHDEGYLLDAIKAKESIHLPDNMNIMVSARYLTNNLFLISCKDLPTSKENTFLVHDVRQQRVVWTRTVSNDGILIPDERAILVYKYDREAQLLDMYTGDILSSFKIGAWNNIKPLIGPLCYVLEGDHDVLVDVRIGKRIRYFTPGYVSQYLSNAP